MSSGTAEGSNFRHVTIRGWIWSPSSCKLAATHTHRIFRHPSMHAYTLLAKRTQVHAVFIIEADVTVVIDTLERRKRQPHEFNASWNGARERGDTEPAFVF